MHRLVLGVAALFSLAAPVAAQTVTNPDWLMRPRAEDMSRVYPALAQTLDLEGRATITCDIDDLGALLNCKVQLEGPPGLGFGQAALALSPLFKMSPKQVDGAPVAGGTVRIPIRFSLPDRPQATPGMPNVDPAALLLARKIAAIQMEARGGVDTDAGLSELEADPMPGVSPEVKAAGLDALRAASKDRPAKAETLLATLYAARLTRPQLQAYLDYLQTPAAREALKSSAAAIETGQRLALELLLLARSKFCAARDCSSTPPLSALRALEAGPKPGIVSPRWLSSPGWADLQRVAPPVARGFGISGVTMMDCKATNIGRLSNCKVVLEQPPGLGFGDAALSLAPEFQLDRDSIGLGADGETVRESIVFAFAPSQRPRSGPGQPPPAAKIALAKELLEAELPAKDLQRQIDDLVTEMIETMPPDRADLVSEARRALLDGAAELWPTMVDEIALNQAQSLSEPQMRQMLAHLKSPLAATLKVVQPQVWDEFAMRASHIAHQESAQARATFCAVRICAAPLTPPASKP